MRKQTCSQELQVINSSSISQYTLTAECGEGNNPVEGLAVTTVVVSMTRQQTSICTLSVMLSCCHVASYLSALFSTGSTPEETRGEQQMTLHEREWKEPERRHIAPWLYRRLSHLALALS